MLRPSTRWLVAGLALIAGVLIYYFCFGRHGKGTSSPTKTADRARKVIAEGSIEARRQAAWDLALSPNPNNHAALEKALDDKDVEVRRTATLALGWIKDPNSFVALARAAKDVDTSVRHDAAWALGRLPQHLGYEALAGLVQDSSLQVSQATINALARLGYPAAEQALGSSTLADRLLEDRLAALVRIKAPSAVDAVLGIADQDLAMALKFAARIDGCRGIPFLVSTAATRGDYKIDDAAFNSLTESTQPCIQDALVELTSKEPLIRRQIIKFFLALGGPRALSELTRLQHDADPSVAQLATDGLAQSFEHRKLSVPNLEQLARSSRKTALKELDRHLSRARILRLLVKAGLTSPGGYLNWLEQARPDLIVPLLIARLSPIRQDWERRWATQSAVDESAVPTLAIAAKSPDSKLREFIAETLLGMIGPNAQSLQLALASDPDLKVRIAALKAYRIAAKPAAEARIDEMLASDQPADFEAAYAASRPNPSVNTFARALQDIDSPDEARKKWANATLLTARNDRLLQLMRQLKSSPQLRRPLLAVLTGTKAVDAFVISRPDIIPIVTSTLADPDEAVVESMACLLEQVTSPLGSAIEAEYRKQGASTSLGKLLASGGESARDCAKRALLVIGDERGLAMLIDKTPQEYDSSEVRRRIRGRLTVPLATKIIQRLARDDNAPQADLSALLATAPASVIAQTVVPLLCSRSSPERSRFLSAVLNGGLPNSLSQLPQGNARDCLGQRVREAFANSRQDTSTQDEQRLAIGLVKRLRDKALVDALFQFAQKSRSDYVGDSALGTLAELGDKRSVPLILTALSSATPRTGLVRALARYEDPRVRPSLLSAFTNVELREDSAIALIDRVPREQWQMLADIATNNCTESYCASSVWRRRSELHLTAPETDLSFRLRSTTYLDENLQLLAEPISSDALLAILGTQTPLSKAPESLRRFNRPATVEQLRAALSHLNPSVRVNAIRVLADWKVPGISEPIAAALNDSISAVRVAAAEALGTLGDAQALPQLGDFVAVWEADTQEFGAGLCAWASLRKDAAANALATYASPGYLSHNVDSAIPSVIRALGCTHSGMAVAPLVSHLERFDSRATEAIDALGETRAPAAAKVLVGHLSQGKRSITLVKALSKFKEPDVLSALATELAQATTADDSYRIELIRTIANYKNRRAIDCLVAGLAQATCDDVAFYISALVSTHDSTVRVPIEQTGVRCNIDVEPWIRNLRNE